MFSVQRFISKSERYSDINILLSLKSFGIPEQMNKAVTLNIYYPTFVFLIAFVLFRTFIKGSL